MMSTIMPAALSMILINPAELKDLFKSCGADNIYYTCGALNDSNKTCGALRSFMSLRSQRCFRMPAGLSTILTKPAEL
jgi:hypothetical protein